MRASAVSLRKPAVVSPLSARVDIDAINYASKCMTKMKAQFSYCDQIKFNEPVPKQEIPE